ncbi:DUF4148 domain-containing protein [Paraburkholderia sp. CNPSo 3157]|uniref:DUF4148 domain-containing protein n=1 Tax=Paraburkholderia franconis TaxID=2654983 RepID=A0A7X1THB4_9BURK|nr:DUF4148 domain-containing protein [Paraburkholderia franconis]MPW19377.1 DUF4148 domain-containing protein [Paraburkholderia franconis]
MLENAMKALILIPVAALSLSAMQVHAADAASTSSTGSESNAAMATDSVGGTTAGATTSGASVGKTRAQVYQELIRAEKDGTLNRINEYYGGN